MAVRSAGPLDDPGRPRWVSLAPEWQGLVALARPQLRRESARTWLVDHAGSGCWRTQARSMTGGPDAQQTTWVQRFLYRLVAGSADRTAWSSGRIDPVRLAE